MLQLNPPLPMLTPKGEGFAHFLIDYGPESDLYWTVFLTASGEVWTFANHEVRASKNVTLGRTNICLGKATNCEKHEHVGTEARVIADATA